MHNIITCVVLKQSLMPPYSFQGNKMTKIDQDECWQGICASLNAVHAENRDVAAIKKKWSQLKSEAKPQLARYKRSLNATGDDPHSMHFELVVAIRCHFHLTMAMNTNLIK